MLDELTLNAVRSDWHTSVKRWFDRKVKLYSFLMLPCWAMTYWSVAIRSPFLPSKTYGLPVVKPVQISLHRVVGDR